MSDFIVRELMTRSDVMMVVIAMEVTLYWPENNVIFTLKGRHIGDEAI